MTWSYEVLTTFQGWEIYRNCQIKVLILMLALSLRKLRVIQHSNVAKIHYLRKLLLSFLLNEMIFILQPCVLCSKSLAMQKAHRDSGDIVKVSIMTI